MKRRLLSLLLSLSLLCSLLPAALADAEEESSPSLTALCVAEPGQSVFLDGEELQLLCLQATGRELESISFPSLSNRAGTFSYRGEPVTSDTAYYLYQRPQLSQISFTPYSRFTGQEELAFTMTNERDETFSGVLLLYVPETPKDLSPDFPMNLTARVKAGEPIPLLDLLPDQVWYKTYSGYRGGRPTQKTVDGTYIAGELTSAAFTHLPSSAQGTLWLNYGTPDARKVLPNETLYSSGLEPNFYDVTFVPATKDLVTVRLDFTASCAGKGNVPGSLTLNPAPGKVTDQPSPATVSTNTAQAGLATALYQACASREEGSLKTVAFDVLPMAGEGTILSGDVPVTTGTAYAYNTLSFLPGDRFQGGVTLRYVGMDSKDQSFSGVLTLALDYPAEGRFQDLTGWEWASYAVKFLDTQKAVPYNSNDPSFRPGDPATRMELIYALIRAAYPAEAGKTAPLPTFSDLPAGQDLREAVAVAAQYGLVLGDGENRLNPDDPITRQDALVIIYRALSDPNRPYQSLPSPGDLSVFSDAGDLAPYAKTAAAVLYAKGVLLGDGAGKLDPLSPITRAEMACLLYRAFGE